MNPTNWQYTHQRQRKSLDPSQRTDSISREKNGNSSLNNKRSHNTIMKGTNAEMDLHNPSSHRIYRLSSNNFSPKKATDPDGDPVELSTEDKELARKRRELQLIQEQISLKKATIAMKRTETFLKAKTPCQRIFKEVREEDLSHSKVDSYVNNTRPSMSRPTLENGIGFSETFLKTKTSCRKFKEDREEDLSHSKEDSYEKNTQSFLSTIEKGVCFSSASNNGPLKERVNVILQHRWPDGCLAKAFSSPSDHLPLPNPVEKTNTLSVNKDDHPLKLRVKALTNRHRNVVMEVPVDKPHPPSRSPSATVGENDLVVKGLQRFISLLNKGVDIDMLTKIVNDDNELPSTGQELLHSQTPVLEQKAEVCKGDSQQLQLGRGQRDTQSCSEERKTELHNQEICHVGSTKNVQPEVKFTCNNDTDGRHFSSCQRSMSPSVEKKSKLEQQQGQLQNILNTIGLSLEANDLCKLAEHGQEKLLCQKDDSSTVLSESHRQYLKRHYSSSSSSNSMSHSPCSSPSRHQHSSSKTPRDSSEKILRHSRKRSREKSESSTKRHSSKTSKERGRERETSKESGREREMSKERGRERDRSKQKGRERERDKNRIDSRDRSPYHRPCPGNPEYHAPYATVPAIPTYNSNALATYTSDKHCTAYNGYYSNGASIAGSYGTNVIPHSSYSCPPGYVYYSANPLCPSAYTGALPGQVYPYPQMSAGPDHDPSYFFNADLSQSEGQTGQDSGPRYLQVINTVKTKGTNRCILKLTTGSWESRKSNTRVNRDAKRKAQKKVTQTPAQGDCSSADNLCPSGITTTSTNSSSGASDSNAQQEDILYHDMLSSVITTNTIHPEPPVEVSTEVEPLEKALPTEEEIKANLKKKLAAFNEKMKHQVPKPTKIQPNVTDW